MRSKEKKARPGLALIAVFCLTASARAWSSLYVPDMPIAPEFTGSWTACVAKLKAMQAGLPTRDHGPVERTDAFWQIPSTYTQGVKLLSGRRAQYVESMTMTNYAVIESGQVRAQSSTDENRYVCDGQVLSGVRRSWVGSEVYLDRKQAPAPTN